MSGVLIVGVDQTTSAQLRRAFAGAGHTVTATSVSGWTAHPHGPIDLLVIGEVAGVGPIELMGAARRRTDANVMLVGYASGPDDAETKLIEALSAGADGWIGLPCDADEVVARAGAILRRRASRSDDAPAAR